MIREVKKYPVERDIPDCLKPVKILSQKLPTFLLVRGRRCVAQQCWISLHSRSNIVVLSPVQTDATLLDDTGWVVCTLYYMLLHVVACCWELFVLFETGQNFEPKTPNISFGPQQCWISLHSRSNIVVLSPVQTDATLLDVTCCVRLHTLLHVVGCY